MEENYICYETAKLAGEKRFKVYQKTQYSRGVNPTTIYHYTKEQCKLFNDVYYRPTQSLLQKWLREKYEIDITIHRSFSMCNSYHYCIIINNNYEMEIDQPCKSNRSYEEALEDALIVSLNIINK